MLKRKLIFASLVVCSNLFASYQFDDPKLGNVALEVGIWDTKLSGSIANTVTTTKFKQDLGYSENKNISFFGMDLKNDTQWMPNIYVNYFNLSNSADGILNEAKQIDASYKNFSGSVSSTTDYSELNTILYGFLQQGSFEFDLGLNLKKINYVQTIKENGDDKDSVSIIGPTEIIPLPYIAFKIDLDFINTVLKAEASILSFGDDEAKDYKYSINYRVMRNMYISYGYRYSSWKSTSVKNTHEKYDINLRGNYLNAKILF
jgi:outer membrane protein